jgi:hypothetical protein
MNMEKRDVKISFHKAGNGLGTKLTLPMPWLRKMGVTNENRDVEIIFNEETKEITIRKK